MKLGKIGENDLVYLREARKFLSRAIALKEYFENHVLRQIMEREKLEPVWYDDEFEPFMYARDGELARYRFVRNGKPVYLVITCEGEVYVEEM